jgi:two-component system KDP operon response regulator KdpE
MKILVIDDDQEVLNIIGLTLRIAWPEASMITARLGKNGLELVGEEAPDLVVLDLGLPDMSGFDVLKEIRLFSDVPVVVLTVSNEEVNVVKGLEMGATEYIVKPFRQMELIARLKVATRVLNSVEPEEICYKFGSFLFYPSLRKLVSKDRTILLTPTESSIVLHLLRNKGNAVSYLSIADKLWGREYPGASDAIRVYIRNLRAKLEKSPADPQFILTKPGIGYYIP